ncbi:hypothetical protein N9E20_00455 [Crocinitomicaceae bacterium]|nr:hypothetical protein [Crocinitomicaceae bacterium]
MKKQILKISGIALVAVIALTSCSKKVSSRKLDGDWTVSSGEGSFVDKENGISLTTSISFDGSKVTTVDYLGEIDTEDQTMSYSFDKKEGTYTQTITNTSYDTNTVSYYSYDLDEYYYEGELERTRIRKETVVISGTFTLTGGTGDIKKNSQIVLAETSRTTTTNNSYKYFDGITQVSNYIGLYVESSDWFSSEYDAMTSSSSETTTETGTSMYAEILNVESSKKDELIINTEESYSEDNSGYSVAMKYTLTQN